MKVFFKKNVWVFCFLAVTIFGLIVRFANYDELINFHLDPPLYMHDVKNVVDSGKVSLIGPPVTSKNVDGRMFFTGPFHYQVLALLGVLSNWNIVFITAFYTLLWVLSFFVIYFWFRNKFGNIIALVIYSMLLFYPSAISMSRQIWNPHFIPLFGALFLMFISERKNRLQYFLSGLFLGLGLNVHYATIIWVVFAGFYLLKDLHLKRFNWFNWFLVLLGIVFAELPLILFEIRHNFYNIQTILFHLKYGSVSVGYSFSHTYYYIYTLLPLFVYILANLFFKLRKKIYYPILIAVMIGIIIFGLVSSFGKEGQKPLYPDGWTIKRQQAVAEIIKADKKTEFEVAETINSDTRALDLRWWLRLSNVEVMDVAKYDIAPVLYLVTTEERPPETETVWEVKVMNPFKVEFKKDIGGGIFLYKLIRP